MPSCQPKTRAATLNSRAGCANSPCVSRYNDTLLSLANTVVEITTAGLTEKQGELRLTECIIQWSCAARSV